MKRSSVKKIISVIVTLLLIVCTVLCIAAVARGISGGDLTLFGCRYFYVVSGSMEPELPVGCLVIAKHSDSGYEIGDVITFISSDPGIAGSTNTHRVIDKEVEEDGSVWYMTKGDANSVPDPVGVREDAVIGKVIFHTGKLTFIGDLLGFIWTPMGFVILILIPVLLIVTSSIKDYVKTYKKAIEDMSRQQAGENGRDEESVSEENRDNGRKNE